MFRISCATLAALNLLAFSGSAVQAATIFTNIVDTTTTAPGHGAFTSFGTQPSINGNNIAFMGSYSGGQGIYTAMLGATGATKIVDFADTAPGRGNFTGFDLGTAVTISGNNVAFVGQYNGGAGVYTGSVASQGASKIVDTGDTAPGHGNFITFFGGPPSVSGNAVAFGGSYTGGTGIYTGSIGVAGATKIVESGDTAPGRGPFTSVVAPALPGAPSCLLVVTAAAAASIRGPWERPARSRFGIPPTMRRANSWTTLVLSRSAAATLR